MVHGGHHVEHLLSHGGLELAHLFQLQVQRGCKKTDELGFQKIDEKFAVTDDPFLATLVSKRKGKKKNEKQQKWKKVGQARAS